MRKNFIYDKYDAPDITDLYSSHPDRSFRYGYPLNYFEISQDVPNMIKAYQIQKGDNVAEIGAASGWCLGLFSLYTDSVHYFAQDIDTNFLNKNQLSKMVAHFSEQKMEPQTNTFDFVIGTPTQTNLPDQYFDIIILNNAYHEFTDKKAMINDIKQKLKPHGRIVVSDLFTNKYLKFKHQGCNIEAESIDSIKVLMEKNGLYLTKTWLPEGNVYNHLTFEMNETKAREFEENLIYTDELIQLSNKKVLKDEAQLDTIAEKLHAKRIDLEEHYDELAICEYFYQLGDHFINDYKYKLAKSVFYVGAKMYPDYSYFYEAQCYVDQYNRRYDDQILKSLNKGIDNYSNSFYYLNSVNIQLLKAQYLNTLGSYNDALVCLLDAFDELEKKQSEVHESGINAQMALIYAELSKLLSKKVFNNDDLSVFNLSKNTSLNAISKAIELDGFNPDFYFDRANMHYYKKEFDLALSDLDRLLYLTPMKYQYYSLRASLKKKMGDKIGFKMDKKMYRFVKWKYWKYYV
jgi:ubiquinone/menaquinone biosynthesis C-methylase UbiE